MTGPLASFNDLAQHIQRAAAGDGLQTCGFKTAPAGASRRIRRTDDGALAIIDPHQQVTKVATDMIDAVVATNQLDATNPATAQTRVRLGDALAGICAQLLADSDPAYHLLAEAYRMAAKSDDPSTQTGAVLVAADGRKVSAHNHLAGDRARHQRWQRPAKDHWVIHAELAVVGQASSKAIPTCGATVYAPWYACTSCARALIAAKVTVVVGHRDLADTARQWCGHWNDDLDVAAGMLAEAGVDCQWRSGPVLGAPDVSVGGRTYCPGALVSVVAS